jgi:hypothetical protein
VAGRKGRWGWISADLVVVVVLLAALVAFSAYTTARQAEEEGAPDHSTHSTASRGAAALYLWLEDLGYRVERIENGPFRVADEVQLLFVLAPAELAGGAGAHPGAGGRWLAWRRPGGGV